MKNLALKLILAVSLVLIMSTGAMAIPLYIGDTYADWGTDGYPDLDEVDGPGFYIWSNDADRTSWSVRWTGGDWTSGYSEQLNGSIYADEYGLYDWEGTISYSGGSIDSLSLVSWDGSDGTLGIPAISGSSIEFTGALAGPHWDGFDFTVSTGGGMIRLDLEGSIYNPIADGGLGYIAPQGLYLGQNLYSITDFYIGDLDGMVGSLHGEIRTAPVPEPATLLLLGSGLLGIGGFNRRKKTKNNS